MPTSYFDREIELYKKVIDIIDNEISEGKDLESVKNKIYKKIKRIEYYKTYS